MKKSVGIPTILLICILLVSFSGCTKSHLEQNARSFWEFRSEFYKTEADYYRNKNEWQPVSPKDADSKKETLKSYLKEMNRYYDSCHHYYYLTVEGAPEKGGTGLLKTMSDDKEVIARTVVP